MKASELARIRQLVAAIPDPEMPTISIEELGILRGVRQSGEGRVVVTITPTYLGCPAIDEIRGQILATLRDQDYLDVEIETKLAPAWTTSWITAAGHERLREQGIAPPRPPRRTSGLLQLGVQCPRCGSWNSRLVSSFGATPCRASHYCESCNEPFDHVRPIE